MGRWERVISSIGTGHIITGLGVLYTLIAVMLAVSLLRANAGLAEVIGRVILTGGPGAVLLYSGYRVSDMDLHPAVYPRIVVWMLGGFGGMLCIVGTMELISPSGIDNPSFAIPLATAIGSVAGLAAGIYDAQAKTRERELEETVEQLRTSNERLEQFAYAASHDLQEPLRMVSSYLRLLENRYADDLDEDAEEFLEYAVNGADRMRRMIDSLLEYSRVSHGAPLEPVNAEAVLDDVTDDLQLRIKETHGTITTDELPTVTADPDQLAQVFRNLISNALTYSGDEPPQIHVGVKRTNDMWQFSVADEGIGIDPEYHNRIFNVFEQLQTDEEASEKRAGGIGLALCERIIERHDGEIWVESEPGEGATFYFTIPVSAGPEGQQSEPAAHSPARG